MQKARRGGLYRILAVAILLVPIAASAVNAKTQDEKLWSGMKYRSIGPFRGGRVLAVAGIAGNPNVYYFGAVAGGVWKTSNGGLTWEPLFDKQPVSSIGAIEVAPSDPNVIYVGTGEGCLRGNISYGNGMYKSVDGGTTWMHIGLENTQHIARIAVDPRNSDIVFVAAVGHAYGPNPDRGVFRTTDGGKTWTKVLYKDDKTGAVDLSFDPANSHIIYAALYQIQRSPWGMESGGPGSGIYKSTDGGSIWKQIEAHGLPEGIYGRIGIAVSGADPNRVYALIEAKEGGLFRSDDAGETWEKINDDHRFRQRAWYFTHIFADPKSANTVYILNTGAFRSIDGGKSFSLLPAPHGDHHGLWIDPSNPERMINSNDGGVTITVDGGKNWSKQDNQPTAQFYHVAADNQFPYWVYGAQQDNTTIAIESRTEHGVIAETDWYPVGGGESGYIVPDPKDPNIIYSGDNAGVIARWDKRTQQAQDVSVWPVDPSGYGVGSLKYRFQWTAPIVVSPHDPSVLYEGSERLFKTTNNGMSWTAISPDLTRNDKTKQEASGGPITKDNTSVEYYDTIFAIAESPVQKDLIWAGTDDGLVQLTQDGGKNWNKVTPAGTPEWSLVSLIEASPFNAGTAYVSVDAHKLDDLKPYIYKTTNFGQSWTKITNGIPDSAYVHAVREDPGRKGLLFAGTETGLFVSFDDGADWQPLQLNLPQAPVHDLVIHGDDLVVATHGRAFWILDDISPLRQVEGSLSGKDVHLFKPQIATIFRTGGDVPPRYFRWYGQNSPNGAVIDYFLKEKPKEKEEVKIEILDSQGKVVRKLSSIPPSNAANHQQEWPDQPPSNDLLPADAGMNRFVWDLLYESPTPIPGAVWDGGDGPKGPLVAPGKYQVKLTAAGATETVPLEILKDPRVKTSPADLEKQLALELKVSASISKTDETVNQIRDLRAQLNALKRRLASDEHAKSIVEAAGALDKKMTAIEEVLINPNVKATEDALNYPVRLNDQLAALLNFIGRADMLPTEQQYAVFEDLNQKLDVQLAKWNEIVAKELPAFNESMRKLDIAVIAPAMPKQP